MVVQGLACRLNCAHFPTKPSKLRPLLSEIAWFSAVLALMVKRATPHWGLLSPFQRSDIGGPVMTLLALAARNRRCVACSSRLPLRHQGNMSFFVYVFIDAALALAVFLNLPYMLWPALIFSVIGFVGLTVRFNQPQRDKTIDRGIWVADLAAIICAIYLLFER
jgi:hypothetical protein